MRYTYDLNKDSVVLDFGGFTGGFAEKITSKYGCKVYIYEAVNRYYQQIVDKNNPNLIPFNCGVSTLNGKTHIHVCDEGSAIGNYAEQKKKNDKNGSYQSNVAKFAHEPPEEIVIRDVVQILNEYDRVDLLKINIEGIEYEILPRIISSGHINKIKHLQIQFHDFVNNGEFLHQHITAELKKSHNLVFESMWNWSFFTKR
jgi:FkbM family methyltransferase